VLYLAEVKKQVKGFLPRTFKTELKLLAWQHNDQTWSAVQGEEVVASNEFPQSGEGALLLVKLSQTRQLEEAPELAGAELVRQLQKLSRLSEKLRDQRQEVEQWKQSLTYQSEELSRRRLELESRAEEFEQARQQLEALEQQRRQLEEGWCRLQQAQQQQAGQPLSLDNFPQLTPEQAQSLHNLSERLGNAGGGTELLAAPLDRLWDILQSRQAILDDCRQRLEPERAKLKHLQQEVQHQEEILQLHRQEFQASRASLEQIKIRFQSEQVTLIAKQELLKRLERHLQEIKSLRLTVGGSDTEPIEESLYLNIDRQTIENMPLGELKEIVQQNQGDLDKLVRFVNDQEEELSLQTQAVRELETQLGAANEAEHFGLEAALAEEQEKKQMLNQTLLGQRRTLRERQKVLLEQLRILRRREGAMEIEEPQGIYLDPLLQKLEDWHLEICQESQQLQAEIDHLQESLRRVAGVIEQQEAEQGQRAEALQIEENNWQQARLFLAQTQGQLDLYAQALQPLQQNWQQLQQAWESLKQWFS
jgi:chromosome segregation ATPase